MFLSNGIMDIIFAILYMKKVVIRNLLRMEPIIIGQHYSMGIIKLILGFLITQVENLNNFLQ